MKTERQRKICWAVIFLIAFVIWTVLVRFVDVQGIGPHGSKVGFATINGAVRNLIGVNWALYTVTDWLGLVPLIFVAGFGILGLVQWIKRKSFIKVDRSLLVLGGLYMFVMGLFLFLEKCVVNYRPVLVDGILEASYPSSTTLLTMCVVPTAISQLKNRIINQTLKRFVVLVLVLFAAFMVIGRLLSGVHWLSDIIGGALLSIGLIFLHEAIIKKNV